MEELALYAYARTMYASGSSRAQSHCTTNLGNNVYLAGRSCAVMHRDSNYSSLWWLVTAEAAGWHGLAKVSTLVDVQKPFEA